MTHANMLARDEADSMSHCPDSVCAASHLYAFKWQWCTLVLSSSGNVMINSQVFSAHNFNKTKLWPPLRCFLSRKLHTTIFNRATLCCAQYISSTAPKIFFLWFGEGGSKFCFCDLIDYLDVTQEVFNIFQIFTNIALRTIHSVRRAPGVPIYQLVLLRIFAGI